MENKHINILAIDDNADNLISIKALLSDAFPEATVFLANSGQKGLDEALKVIPDIILLDIVMPLMDGFDVCRKLKADANLKEIPVVFLTAIKGDKESRITALECGAEAFLAKPIDESELTAQIRAMVKINDANILKRDEKERLAQLIEAKTSELAIADKELAFQNQEKDKRAAELLIANKELAFQNQEKDKRAAELVIANKELAFQNEEKEKRAAELAIANVELAFQNKEKANRASELIIADKKLAFQNVEKAARASELVIADKELAFQSGEKADRAAELLIANRELASQNEEKDKRTAELIDANRELAFQNEEKEKRAAELLIANKELAFQNKEKDKRAAELIVANKELAFQNEEKEKRAAELIVANKELAYQNEEKEKRATELAIANVELAYQNEEKANRASELVIADKKLAFQNVEKADRASELVIADKELAFQSGEKADRAAELIIANKELAFQNTEKDNRAAELLIANMELAFQNEEKDKRAAELIVANKELAFQNEEKEKRAAELAIANVELAFQNQEKDNRAAELLIANKELAFQNKEKDRRAAELIIANKELAFQNDEKVKRAAELAIANVELAYQNEEKANRASELVIADKKLAFQSVEKAARASELVIADKELAFQSGEKADRAAELLIANKELAFQNTEKDNRAAELLIANKELAFQNEEKDKRAAELLIANKELAFQNKEKDKRAAELIIANKELAFQNEEKEKRAAELAIANVELAYQNEEKANRASELVIADKKLAFQRVEKAARASELVIADKELAFQSGEKADRAAELLIANKELAFQNQEKDNRAAELLIANKELAFQNKEKDKRAAELIVANKELAFQNEEKEKRAAELIVANKELAFQNKEKDKRAAELIVANKELAFQNEEKEKRAAELIIANKELAFQNEEKKRRVKLTGELKEQNIELEIEKKLLAEASLQKSSFLSNMSHEIRTPLNAIIGFTELVLKTKLTLKQYNYLSKIRTSSRTLLGLISDILDLSKIEAGKLELEIAEFNLNEVMQNVINQVSIKSNEKGLNLQMLIDDNVPTHLKGDSLRLGQILLNLVSNAVKFTDKGNVFIHIKLLKKNETTALIHFSIEDTGIGLSEKQIGILFQPFTQADTSTTSKYGGTGLGLSIAHKLVNLMEGEIGVTSKFGIGSTFYFTAKIDIAEKERYIDYANLFQKWGKKVLLVDDEKESGTILSGMLQSMALDVYVCSSGEESIAELQKEKNENSFGLVLMDWKMPKMNGIEAAKRIKRIFPANKCPAIVIITAYNSDELQEKSAELGLEAILLKPIPSSLLLNTIMQIINKDDFESNESDPGRRRELPVSPQLEGIRVLLVEDNEINQEVAKEILSQAGLIVTIANNGQEAIARIKSTTFDIVLMDIQMPIMDGYDATREIRKDPAFTSLPIISMTANALLRDQQKCLQAGMNDNISKPIDTNQLFQKILQWVGRDKLIIADESKSVGHPTTRPKNKFTFNSSDLYQLESFDFISSLDRLGGNEEFYYRLLEKFYHNHFDEIARIRHSLNADDLKTAKILSHTLKSAASNIGALSVSEAANLLEYEIDENRLGNIETLMKQLEKTMDDALTSISRYLKNTVSSEPADMPDIDIHASLPLLKKLAKSLAENDITANQYLEELLLVVKNSKISDQIAEIKALVEQYDYEKANLILQNLVNSLKEDKRDGT